MVAPADLGEAAARLLTGPPASQPPHHVEGPERYSSADVAGAFAAALGRDVTPDATPRKRGRPSGASASASPRRGPTRA